MKLFPFQDLSLSCSEMALANQNKGTEESWICIQLTVLVGLGHPGAVFHSFMARLGCITFFASSDLFSTMLSLDMIKIRPLGL